jgi:hypothetical protein
MKKALFALAFISAAAIAAENETSVTAPRQEAFVNEPVPAGSLVVLRVPLGAGTPGQSDLQPATYVGEGLWHAPQYLPAFPTAAEIWPRTVTATCEKEADRYVCDGFNWLPGFGRAEYLFIQPVVKIKVQPPTVVERTIIKEVPVKPKMQ